MWPDDESIINISIPASGLECGLFYSFRLEVFHVKVGDDWREWRAHGDTVCLFVELAVDTEVGGELSKKNKLHNNNRYKTYNVTAGLHVSTVTELFSDPHDTDPYK